MKKIIFGLIILGLTIQTYAQVKTEKLSEVVVSATNYKYLTATGLENASLPVRLLEQKVAEFDLKNSEFYRDDYDYYSITFYIPDNTILAAYDKDGTIIRTIERYKNVRLPRNIVETVAATYPNWTIAKDVYLVNYHHKDGITKKYKLVLENGDERIRVKLNADAEFL